MNNDTEIIVGGGNKTKKHKSVKIFRKNNMKLYLRVLMKDQTNIKRTIKQKNNKQKTKKQKMKYNQKK